MNICFNWSRNYSLAGILALVLFSACKKEQSEPVDVKELELIIRMDYTIEGKDLIPSQIQYVNEAGNPFSIQTLKYYLSGIALENEVGEWTYYADILYMDAFDETKKSFSLKGLKAGRYKSLHLLIGLDSLQNESQSLPNTAENLAMVWPEGMGGGYHFLKLEGHFLDRDSANFGFAMHIGKTGFNSEVLLEKAFELSEGKDSLNLVMNITEWFRAPNTYDFNVQGNYSMGRDTSMRKLSENGHNVLSFK